MPWENRAQMLLSSPWGNEYPPSLTKYQLGKQALAKLTDAERVALGVLDENPLKRQALAKLTEEERKVLGC